MGYLAKYEELVQKSRIGQLSTAELAYFIQRFDPAEIHAFEQAKQLSTTLLRQWLAKYKFKDWGPTTATRKLPVDQKMKENRAYEIASVLSDTKRWHTHGRGISMGVLRKDLNLKIDDFGDYENERLGYAVTNYHRTLSDYISVLGIGASSAMVHRPGMCREF